MNNSMPYKLDKIPVLHGLAEFLEFKTAYPDFYLCPYVADKTAESWNVSTSRVYMNQVLSDFLYVPVNINKDDTEGLRTFFVEVAEDRQIAAVNITQPHKSSPVIKELFLDNNNSDKNVDTLIRDTSGILKPFDLNAPSFVDWYKDEVGDFTDKTVVMVGVGGVGEPIAKAIARDLSKRLILVDPIDKSYLLERLGGGLESTFAYSLDDVTIEANQDIVLINASGKEGVDDTTGILKCIQKHVNSANILVDIRPHLNIDIVQQARDLGWRAFTGHGMNARNDYTLLLGIAEYMGVDVEPFELFQKKVAAAS